MTNRSSLFWGVLLVIIGIALMLGNFGLVPAGLVPLWPLLVIGVGLWLLARAIRQHQGGNLVGGVVVLTVGVFWLLENYHLVKGELFLPVFLIALGVGLILRNWARTN